MFYLWIKYSFITHINYPILKYYLLITTNNRWDAKDPVLEPRNIVSWKTGILVIAGQTEKEKEWKKKKQIY